MRWQHASVLALCLLGLVYLLQLASPLRTNTDATMFLSIAASVSDGKGFLLDGKKTHFPIGFPLTLSILDRLGIACSATLIGLNLLALAAGLACAGYLLEKSFGLERTVTLTVVLLSLLCWVVIKHVTLPLTDIPYMGLSLGSVAVLTRCAHETGPRRYLGLAAGSALAVAAILYRTVGIALLPAVGYAILAGWGSRSWRSVVSELRGKKLAALVGALGILALASVLAARARYTQEMIENFQGTVRIGDLVRFKLEDWGELLLNTSTAKLPGPIQALVPVAGVLLAALVVRGASLRGRLEVIDVYMVGYCTILLVWPYRDARFWIPLFPILVGYGWLVYRRYARFRLVRWAGVAYLSIFFVSGAMALAYSTWLSFSSDKFAERYAGGVYRGSYRTAFAKDRASAPQNAPVDPQIVSLLQRYQIKN